MSVETLEDDVPVYESLYPELEERCSHPPCDNDTPGNRRICEECTPVMLDNTPNNCQYCGASASRNIEDVVDEEKLPDRQT